MSAGADTANCYQHENVQFKAKKKKKKKNSQRMKRKTWSFTFEYVFLFCVTPGSHFSGSGKNMLGGFLWYNYRYMVILLFATTTRRLSMQMKTRRLKSVDLSNDGNQIKRDKRRVEQNKETGRKAPCDWEVWYTTKRWNRKRQGTHLVGLPGLCGT